MTRARTRPSPATDPARLPALTRRTAVAGLLGGAALTFGVALTATSGWLIVRASERPVILTLLVAIVAVRAFGMGRPVFRYWERLRSHDAALADLAQRRTRAYARLVPLTPARLGNRGHSDVLTGVVDDLDDVANAQVRVTVPVVSTLVASGFAAVLTAVLLPAVGFVVAALLGVAAGTTALAWRWELEAQAEVLAARAEVGRVSGLVASQAAALQSISAQEAALSWVREAHATAAAAVQRQSRGRSLVAAVLPAATAAATVAAAFLVRGSGLSAPVAALVVLAPFALSEVLSPLTDATSALARAQGSSRRLREVLEQQPAVAGVGTLPGPSQNPVGDAPRLVLTGVIASWDDRRPAVGPIDLDLAPGSTLAITGPNGCGKSTLLAVLARHLDPGRGSYLVDGQDVLDLDLQDVRSLCAVVDDEPHLFASTVRENLRLALPGADDASVEAALDQAGLRDWRTHLRDGLDTRLGVGGTGVSGGERARLAIARALLSGRPVLLLDEPVAHLDHPTAEAVLEDLLDAARGRTVVMVSHRPDGLHRFGRILDLTPATVG